MDQRLNELTAWAGEQAQHNGLTVDGDVSLSVVSGDASFRRYFRLHAQSAGHPVSLIVMDAPPAKESCDAYIQVAIALEQAGLSVPHLVAVDRDKGFLLLSDLGDELYLTHLNESTAHTLYGDAMRALHQIQQCELLATQLPLYDTRLLRTEMTLFTDWFCEQLLQLRLNAQEQALINRTFELLIDNALEQPQVCVHRDYHSRNLMRLAHGGPGILDFQDAVKGAITYDLVSLLKDCYIAWPREQVERWVVDFADQLREQHQLPQVNNEQFLRWFDWMGLQRHLKVLGIFSRLKLRDHKPRYINDIPLVLEYVLDTTARYDVLLDFHQWLKDKVLPSWQLFYRHEATAS